MSKSMLLIQYSYCQFIFIILSIVSCRSNFNFLKMNTFLITITIQHLDYWQFIMFDFTLEGHARASHLNLRLGSTNPLLPRSPLHYPPTHRLYHPNHIVHPLNLPSTVNWVHTLDCQIIDISWHSSDYTNFTDSFPRLSHYFMKCIPRFLLRSSRL